MDYLVARAVDIPSAEDWQRIYDSLTNPEEMAKNRRAAERKARALAKIADVGL